MATRKGGLTFDCVNDAIAPQVGLEPATLGATSDYKHLEQLPEDWAEHRYQWEYSHATSALRFDESYFPEVSNFK